MVARRCRMKPVPLGPRLGGGCLSIVFRGCCRSKPGPEQRQAGHRQQVVVDVHPPAHGRCRGYTPDWLSPQSCWYRPTSLSCWMTLMSMKSSGLWSFTAGFWIRLSITYCVPLMVMLGTLVVYLRANSCHDSSSSAWSVVLVNSPSAFSLPSL